MLLLYSVIGLFACTALLAAQSHYFEIVIKDAETGRGIPLVELETVHRVKYVTDNAGRVAYLEPGTEGQKVYFTLQAHGYETPVDGFGISGVQLMVQPGGSAEITLKRINLAERLYRATGQGLYRDSLLLGKDTPLQNPVGAGKVSGQDSVTGIPYRNKIYWFWGDTSRLSYPLGLFRMAGAVSKSPEGKEMGLPVSEGMDYSYFTDKDGFCRAMAEVEDPKGVVWLFGITTVPDEDGQERMIAHYSRRKGLGDEYQHGMMVYNDDREMFEVSTTLPLDEKWRFLDGQPVHVKEEGKDYIYGGVPFPNIRVAASLKAVMDPAQYEVFTCVPAGSDAEAGEFEKDEDGAPKWVWRKDGVPVTSKDEARWVKRGKLKPEQARLLPADAQNPDKRVQIHTGSVKWNEYRKKWIMIAVEYAYDEAEDYPSPLGEVWYSESDSPVGPFKKALKVVTHQKQTFYNPVHHPFFDEEGGRTIYFEGTYTNQFVPSPPTPYYDYNQIMYRVRLDSHEMGSAFPR